MRKANKQQQAKINSIINDLEYIKSNPEHRQADLINTIKRLEELKKGIQN